MTNSQPQLLTAYLASLNGGAPNSAAAAFYASLDHIAATSPSVAAAIVREFRDQSRNLKLIASENFSSLATQMAHANLFTDKYSEGFPGHRFYAGCDNVDDIENEADRLACELFGADHAYAQPHSGADANLVAFMAILAARVQDKVLAQWGEKNALGLDDAQWRQTRHAMQDHRLLALDLYSGGHLTHGYRMNISGFLFESHTYSVDPETKLLDLDNVAKLAREVKPLVLLAGYSAYPRKINFAKMRQIADDVGAVFMVDMAHFAGLVAGKVFQGDYDPVAHAHIVTTTTHKTLRGPRGGLVLCKDEFKDYVDKGCPAILGGPLPHAMAAKAVAFREATAPTFREYAARVAANASALAESLQREGVPVLTGGTDNHLVLINVAEGFGLTGRQAETALRSCGVTLNRNAIPFDPQGAWYTSGLRVGTPALTTLGMGAAEMAEVATVFKSILCNAKPKLKTKGKDKGQKSLVKYTLEQSVIEEARAKVADLLSRYPLYPELDLDLLLERIPVGEGSAASADAE